MSNEALNMRGPVHGTKDAKTRRHRLRRRRRHRDLRLHRLRHRRCAVLRHCVLPGRRARWPARWPPSPPSASGFAARPHRRHHRRPPGRQGGPQAGAGGLPDRDGCGHLRHRPAAHLRAGGPPGPDPAGDRAHHPGHRLRRRMGRRDPDELRARPLETKGRYTGIVQAGFPVGLLLANLVFLVSVHLGGDWAWRVPFLASIVLVIVGLIIRSKVPESPVFEEVKEQRRHRQVPHRRGDQDRLAQHRRAASACASPRPPATRCRSPT